MARTNVKGSQVLDGSVGRGDLNTTVSGSAVITKLIASNGVAISSSTGADSGTGDVTVAADLTFLDSKYPSITASRTQNYVLAAPASGSGAAVFRALVAGDIPAIGVSGITGLQTSLDSKWALGGNALSNTGTLGSTTDQNIQLIRNSVAGLTLKVDGITDVKKLAVGRISGLSGTSWDSLAVFGGNVTIGGRDSVIQGSYDLNLVAHTTNDNAGNTTRKARLKFGYYDAANFIDKFKRTIEYWRAGDMLVIGSHSTLIADTATSAPIESNSVYFGADGSVKIGTSIGTYKLDVIGTGHFSQDVTFDANALLSTAPTSGNHLVNKSYADSKLSGTGTTNYLAKYTASGTLGNSNIFENTQGVGIGSNVPGINTLKVSKDISTSGLGGGIAIGIRSDGEVAADVSATAYYFRSDASTAAAVTNIMHYSANQSTFGGAVATQIGFYVDDLLNASSNIGFRGNIAAAATNWNLYMSGTANNYLAGSLGIGTMAPSTRLSLGTFWNSSAETVGINLSEGSISGGLPAYGFGFGPAGTEGYVTYRSGTGNGSAFGHKFFINNVEVIRVRGDGNLGIGTSTPIYKLDVSGNARLTSTLIITGAIANGNTVAYFDNNNTTTDQSYGLLVDAGTSANDYILKLRNASATEMLVVNGLGTLGIGTPSLSNIIVRIGKAINGSSGYGYGIFAEGQMQSGVTTGIYYNTGAAVASTANVTSLIHYASQQGTFSGPVTAQYGFYAGSSMAGATNNYGFYGALGNGNWNLYMAGTGSNYLNGRLGIGANILTDRNLQLALPIIGNETAYGMISNGQVQSGVTGQAHQFFSQANAASNVTLSTYAHYTAVQGVISGSITYQNGFYVPSLSGATNNFAFRGSIGNATGAWNLYMDGSANNFIGGKIGINTLSLTDRNLALALPLSPTTPYSFFNYGTVQISATSAFLNYSQSNVSAGATVNQFYHYIASQGTLAGNISSQYGFVASSALTGATNNYGFYGGLEADTGVWNLYMGGSASNYLGGRLGIGTINSITKLTVADTTAPIISINRIGVGYGIIGISGGTSASAGDMYFDMGQASGGYFFRCRNASNTIVNAIGVDRNGNVGIGTFAPEAKLDVVGDIALSGTTGTNNILMKNGNIGSFIHVDFPEVTNNSANFRLFRLTNTTGNRIFTIFKGDGTANAQHQLNADGSSYINALNGNLGIGTANTPTAKLHVYTGGLSGATPIIDLEANGTGGRPYLRFKAEGLNYGYFGYGGAGNAMGLMNYQNNSLSIGTNNAFYMTMLADGKVGFGNSITPSTDVHISGTGVKQLRLQSTDNASIMTLYGFTYGQLLSQNDLYLSAGVSSGRVVFQSSGVTRGLITAAGDMILSSSVLTPVSRLDVDGTLTLRSGATVTNSITGGVSVNGTARSMQITYNSSTTTEGILFKNINPTPNLNLMFLRGDGNVGINTITPEYKLDVNGSARFTENVIGEAAPTDADHLVNKAYVDSRSAIKRGETVKTISLTNITLSGTQTVNSVALVAGDLILVAGQSTAANNGVYVVSATTWTRSTNNDSEEEIKGAYHLITAGTYANQRYINTNTSTITVNTTAITYALDFGAETDPVWSAFKTTYDITPARIGQWNAAYSWGNHASAGYATTSAIAGTVGYLAKFTASGTVGSSLIYDNGTNIGIGTNTPESNFLLDIEGNTLITSLNVGTAALSVNILNYMGTAPRIATVVNGTLDIFAPNLYFYTNGDAQMARLNSSGLKIGTGTAAYNLDVTGNVAYNGSLYVGNPALGVPFSNGTSGQFLRRTTAGGSTAINEWKTLAVADISDITTAYQAKLSGTGFVKITGSTISYDNNTYLTTATTTTNIAEGTGLYFTTARVLATALTGYAVGTNTTLAATDTILQAFQKLQGQVNNRLILGGNASGVAIIIGTNDNFDFSLERNNATQIILKSTGTEFAADVDFKGKLKINGNAGLDHQFIKYNGSSNEWAYLNTGELQDKNNLIMLEDISGEKGFQMFSDSAKTYADAFVFTNSITGVVLGLHGYAADANDAIKEFGMQLSADGNLYHKKLDGTRSRIATVDMLGSGGNAAWNGGAVANDILLPIDKSIIWDNYGAQIKYEHLTWVVGSPKRLRITTNDQLFLGTNSFLQIEANQFYFQKTGPNNAVEIDFHSINSFPDGHYVRGRISVTNGVKKLTFVSD
ncbi:hypothetical protein [Emticicia sp. C21]|uniref:beta strand repeat-containing protein n=1 Tax=Emticicia sp. C21 TaxID=2302915 RepID=UPI000E34CA1F|nr:hypothetical protein [Emticicia sp. C21]RFS16997.1 hypothetical protein D0T08_09985 [Emticicia sp. C21]